jgi:hypothetical protein
VSEKAREARLRRLALRNWTWFTKVRSPFWEGGCYVRYMLTNDRNFACGYWTTLEEAEADLLPAVCKK